MALTTCPECQGKLSSTASRCPHCGFEPAQKCPECAAEVVAKAEFCKGCGYPLKKPAPPQPVEVAPPKTRPSLLSTRGRNHQAQDPEPAAALVCAILGLFFPILSLVGLGLSKEGTPARMLSALGVFVWLTGVFLFMILNR